MATLILFIIPPVFGKTNVNQFIGIRIKFTQYKLRVKSFGEIRFPRNS
jgi:hypothetical protein